MRSVDEELRTLPGFDRLEGGRANPNFWTSIGGMQAFGGALRFFASRPDSAIVSVEEWNASSTWSGTYGQLSPPWPSVGEDAFGTQYLLDPAVQEISIFWPETGEVEPLSASPLEFIQMIRDDPETTLCLPFYRDCVANFGDLHPDQHFALRVETSVGGKLDLGNVIVMQAITHMRALGKLAVQLEKIPVGTRLRPVPE